MDNSLVPNRLTPKINIIMVLILVVMDNSLVLGFALLSANSSSRLNPCCNGQ